jgi:hypothetical protein
MSETTTLWIVGSFFVIFSAVSLWYLRRAYRRHGKLSWIGSMLHVMMFVINGMFVGVPTCGLIAIQPMGSLYRIRSENFDAFEIFGYLLNWV